MAIVQIADFKGLYHLAKTNLNTLLLQDCIDKYEKKYLIRLFGVELYDLFIAGLLIVPIDAKWTALVDAFVVQDNNEIIESDGLKVMLLGFIYYEYSKLQLEKNTPIGNVQPSSENSQMTGLSSMVVQRQFWAVDNFVAIQKYVNLNNSLYSTFNGAWIKYEYNW